MSTGLARGSVRPSNRRALAFSGAREVQWSVELRAPELQCRLHGMRPSNRPPVRHLGHHRPLSRDPLFFPRCALRRRHVGLARQRLVGHESRDPARRAVANVEPARNHVSRLQQGDLPRAVVDFDLDSKRDRCRKRVHAPGRASGSATSTGTQGACRGQPPPPRPAAAASAYSC